MKDDGERIRWTKVDYHSCTPLDSIRNLSVDRSFLNIIVSSQNAYVKRCTPQIVQFDDLLQNTIIDHGIEYKKVIADTILLERSQSTCLKQITIVRYFARHLLDSALYLQGDTCLKRDQLRMMVLGAGGTGKSWIIKVMQKMLSACKIQFRACPSAVRVTLNNFVQRGKPSK
jgi:hypothetical protein